MSDEFSNKDYYDLIAPEYNNLFRNVSTNNIVRSQVAKYFKDHVPPGTVLDFGGGTGLDLPWLLKISSQITFCEPASEMRRLAIKQTELHPERKKIQFLNDNECDFNKWGISITPIDPVDSCLSNFAVLNNIRDLQAVFEKLSLIIKPGGQLILSVLDTRSKFLLTRYLKSYLKSFFGKEIIIYSRFKTARQEVYLHTFRKIKAYAHPHFTFRKAFPLGGYGFTLIHFSRK